jgi:hypothetical protein
MEQETAVNKLGNTNTVTTPKKRRNKMKKLLTVVALSALVATGAYAAQGDPKTGIIGSPHDMNTVGSGLAADVQGRACAFCHTPHHTVDLGGTYNPLWSHNVTTMTGVIPYSSPTFDAEINGSLIDPLIGPSRLCMSCHDGSIAPDQHYGTADTGASGRFASDDFSPYTGLDKNIAVGLGSKFSNDHPIGFDILKTLQTDNVGAFRANLATTAQWWAKGAVDATTKPISAGLFVQGPAQFMTCATCHDVHNKDNALNTAANDLAGHADTKNKNYLVYAPQSGSQLCLSCHDK